MQVIDVKSILAVVAMVPFGPPDVFFVVEKPGLDVLFMSGVEEDILPE